MIYNIGLCYHYKLLYRVYPLTTPNKVFINENKKNDSLPRLLIMVIRHETLYYLVKIVIIFYELLCLYLN